MSDLQKQYLACGSKRMDEASFARVYIRYVDTLGRIVGRIVGSLYTEDLIQEIFIKIWLNIGSYDAARGDFDTWVKTVAVNVSRDHLRRTKKLEEIMGDLRNSMQESCTLDDLILDKLDVACVLSHLCFQEQQIVTMKYIIGLTQEQMVRVSGRKLGTIKSANKSILKKLKIIMGVVSPMAESRINHRATKLCSRYYSLDSNVNRQYQGTYLG